MCDDGPDPTYQGRTYRREKVRLNDNTLSQYGSAWKGSRNKNGTLGSSVNESRTVIRNPVKQRPSIGGVPQTGGPSFSTGSSGQQSSYNIWTQPAKQFNIDAHLDPGVYGASDGSFLTSEKTGRSTAATSPFTMNNAPPQYNTYRYIEDPNGRYGAGGYNDKGAPTEFMSLDDYQVSSTSGKKQLKLSDVKQPNTRETSPKDRRKRQTGSVSTSSFRIELGTPTKKSGLRVPT